MNLDVATAQSRHQAVWTQQQYTWEKLVNKLKTTHRTAESYATYISSPVPRQAEIKDIGGFVGGYLVDGHRRKGSVKHRQILALDVDAAYPDFWDDWTMYYPVASLVYSTHKHSPVSPRLRLVLPLDRPVTPEEYEAIGRKVGSYIGLKHLDRTTFQAERMMFWPSTSKDGDYYFREQQGAWLSADSVLAEYRDWRNVAEWPLCPTETEIVRSDLKRQQDPLEKEGVVGAFCRVYSIPEAIEEFLPDVYSECGDNRYTYSEGTTAAGAVCYDDKFLYSHHSTDPASGQLCNAFDLVRIHKFGNDKDSLGKMMSMASTDAKVVKELGIFSLDKGITENSDTDWLGKLDADRKGYQPTINNFLLILRNDPRLRDKFSYNEFDYRFYVGDVPWNTEGKRREIRDSDEGGVRHYFESKYGIYHAAKSKDAFGIACRDNSYHPVKDYLNSLEWDGVPRLDTLFIDQLGAPDNEYTRAVTRKSLVAAVARVMNPGIKFDYMVVAIGSQGKGKSSLLFDLGGDWFSDTLDGVTGKEAYLQIQGAWLIEMAELSSIKKAEVEAVKHFISKREDRFRVPFMKYNETFRRQGVFFGSTNEHTFLIDKTGNRRFWPLVVTERYKPGSIDRDPIWAEAVWRYKQGEELYLSDELEAMANDQQADHTEVDERAGIIQDFLEMPVPKDWEIMSHFERTQYFFSGDYKDGTAPRDRVCAAEIWTEVFKNNFAEMSAYNTKFIHNILMNLRGWKRAGTLSYKKYGKQRSYARIGSKAAAMASSETSEGELAEWEMN